MLRASAELSGQAVDLRGLVDPAVPLGIAAGGELIAFVDALDGDDAAQLSVARDALAAALGADAVVAAAAVAANFARNDRIANATGIPLEAQFVEQSEAFRAALGVDGYASARNTLDAPPDPGAGT